MHWFSRRQRKRLFAIAVLCATGVVGCSRLDSWQRQTIFNPNPERQSWWRDPPAGTKVYDLTVASGQHVNAWYWQSANPDAPTVLYLHGARWNLNGSAFRLEGWTDMGYSVLAIDYRGFGESSPLLPSESSAYDDAAAGLKELERLQPDPSKRFVYGHSLGGAIAIDLMSRNPTAKYAGMIVESGFTSVSAMVATLKWGAVPGVALLVTQPFDSLDKVGKLGVPLLFMHGTADSVIPDEMSDELYHAAQKSSVAPNLIRLVKFPGATHSNAVRSGVTYSTPVESFIRDAQRAYPNADAHNQTTLPPSSQG